MSRCRNRSSGRRRGSKQQHADLPPQGPAVPDLLWQQVRSVDLSAAAAQWRGDPQPDGWQVDLRLNDQHGVQLQPLTSRLVELRWQPVYWTPLDGRSVRLVGGVDAYDQLMGRRHAHPFVNAPAIRPAAQPKDRRWTVRWNPADGPLRLPNRFAARHGSGTGIGWLSVRITVPGVGVVENATIVADPPPFLVDSWGHYR